MTILGIETSCDETSAAILENGKPLSNIISSQTVHADFGGVVPELASREHLRLLPLIVKKALNVARKSLDKVNAIAVTHGPGLVGALLVGLNFAKGLSLARTVPFIGINHMEGHIYGNLLTQKEVKFPVLFLIVSGGHTLLALMMDHLKYKIIGSTRDDAVGEAFDKTAKILSLGYPGGPVIDKMAKQGDGDFVTFPRAFIKEPHYDFSYSGLKTAVLTYLNKIGTDYVQENIIHVCASFQKAAVEVLVAKTMRAAKEFKVASIAVAGGVAANSLLRSWLQEESAHSGFEYYQPELQYCMDNAAMIARAGLEYLQRNVYSPQSLNAFPVLKLKSLE